MNPALRAPYRELPDGQVLDAAAQYESAFRYLIGLPPASFVLLPALHTGAVALELYVKAWGVYQVEIPDPAGLGVIVRARMDAYGHRLVKLLDATPKAFRDALERRCKATPLLNSLGGATQALATCDGLFVASRYPYEQDKDIRRFRIDVLGACIDALSSATDDTRSVFSW